MTDRYYTGINVPAELAEEFQHALLGLIGSDWSLEINIILMDLIKGMEYEKDRAIANAAKKEAGESDA